MDHSLFNKIISVENLYLAWNEFSRGKRSKPDVQLFEFRLEDNLFRLHYELKVERYRHSKYVSFNVTDPKTRLIHKALVVDRIFHHAVFRVLYPIFDKKFIRDSYSCRINKGTHKAIKRLDQSIKNVSRNYSRNCFVLKCDIEKFFHSVDHSILLELIGKEVSDNKAMTLIKEIVSSFSSKDGKGIPLGNLTSQLFANIYMNELDQYVKHEMKTNYYIRYTDDFVIIHHDEAYLRRIIFIVEIFLKENLGLNLHPRKVSIRKASQGIDYLGYIVFPHFTLIRTRTKKRLLKNISNKIIKCQKREDSYFSLVQTLASYSGILKHCRGFGIHKDMASRLN